MHYTILKLLCVFQLDPQIFKRPVNQKPASEADFVCFIGTILRKVFQGSGITLRPGELVADCEANGSRRKVDLIAMRSNVQLSHSEFSRSCPRNLSTGSSKYWNDRSKITRLNQRIYNNLRKYGSTQALPFNKVVIKSGLHMNLIGLQHVDHGVYIIDTEHFMDFPSKREEIKNLLELVAKLRFFKLACQSKKTSHDCAQSTGAKIEVLQNEYQQVNPAFTKQKKLIGDFV
ncbi:hypothetical protein HK096_003868 [Nowakowskiella sp. JEL0078]|nr:hypothetical protein HK096_003868 [Nowakowskiella sp. JEL0078]